MRIDSHMNVPRAAERLLAYYQLPNRGLGGCVHIITEDANCEQEYADWCASNAREWGDSWGGGALPEDVEVAKMLAAMSTTQRRELAAMAFYGD